VAIDADNAENAGGDLADAKRYLSGTDVSILVPEQSDMFLRGYRLPSRISKFGRGIPHLSGRGDGKKHFECADGPPSDFGPSAIGGLPTGWAMTRRLDRPGR